MLCDEKETLLITSYRAPGRKSVSGVEPRGFCAVSATSPLKRQPTSSAINPPKKEEKEEEEKEEEEKGEEEEKEEERKEEDVKVKEEEE